MPEALWLTFNPIAEDEKGWKLEKSGEWISPFDVAASGNRHMHCVQTGFAYKAAAVLSQWRRSTRPWWRWANATRCSSRTISPI